MIIKMNSRLASPCLIALFLFMADPCVFAQITPSASELMDKYNARIVSIQSGESSYVATQHLSRELRPTDADVIDHYRHIFSGAKEFLDQRRHDKSSKALLGRSIAIWNGEYHYALHNLEWDNPNSRPEMMVLKEKPLEPIFGPKHVYRGLSGIDPMISFTEFEKLFVENSVEAISVNNKTAYKLSCDFNIKRNKAGKYEVKKGDGFHLDFYLSAEHYLPVKIIFNCEGFKRPDTVESVVYHNFNGVMYPISAVRFTNDPEVSHSYAAEIAKTKLNVDIDEAVFTPNLKPGTYIQDYIMDAKYIYLPDDLINKNMDTIMADFKKRQTSPAYVDEGNSKTLGSVSPEKNRASTNNNAPPASEGQRPDHDHVNNRIGKIAGVAATVLAIVIVATLARRLMRRRVV